MKKNENKITHDLIEETVRSKVKEIGYEQDGFHWNNLIVENHLHKQSQDISIGVDQDEGKRNIWSGRSRNNVWLCMWIRIKKLYASTY